MVLLSFSVETENGISVSQGGKLKEDGKTFVTHGSFSFTGKLIALPSTKSSSTFLTPTFIILFIAYASGADNRRYRTRWTADERGYHPVTELEEVEIPE